MSTSFPGLQCEDEETNEEALVWAGHVSTQKMVVFDSYSSRSGGIFFDEIYKSSKQINSQKTSQSILFMCRAKFGTNQLKSMKTPSMFSKTPTLAVQEQCLPTNFIPFTIFVLFYRIVAIFKYSGYSETVKLGGVTNLVETTSA